MHRHDMDVGTGGVPHLLFSLQGFRQLTPATPGHGIYRQVIPAEHCLNNSAKFLFRDRNRPLPIFGVQSCPEGGDQITFDYLISDGAPRSARSYLSGFGHSTGQKEVRQRCLWCPQFIVVRVDGNMLHECGHYLPCGFFCNFHFFFFCKAHVFVPKIMYHLVQIRLNAKLVVKTVLWIFLFICQI